MFKKIALAAALVSSAAFATWDYYPVLDAGKGSAKGGLYYDWDHQWSQSGLTIGGRYTVIQGLEISLQDWGYQFWGESDCKGCIEGGDGLRDLILGVRYQIDPMVNIFLDFKLPVGNDKKEYNGLPSETTPPGHDEIALYLGGQFSMQVKEAPGLKFGSEGALDWGFEHDKYERGLDLHLSGEIGYTVPNTDITPFFGLKVKYRLSNSSYDDTNQGDRGDKHISLWLGADAFIIPNQLDLVGKLIVRSGDQTLGGDATGIYAGAEFFF
jgi:hypothetical protein